MNASLSPGPRGRPRICIVTPVYNEEQGLDAYVETVRRVLLAREDCDFRVLFVDDGSSDRSWEIIERICRNDPRFRGLRLSRNFGAHVALAAGLEHAEGDAVVVLACDLQDPPETVLEFVARWREGYQVVWGKRRHRAESVWRQRLAAFFLWLLRTYALPRGTRATTGSFLLMDRVVVDAFRRFREHHRLTFAIVAWTGFRQTEVLYDRRARTTGRSGWTLAKLLGAVGDAFVGYSRLPITLVNGLGLATCLVSFGLMGWTLVSYFLWEVKPGWPSLIVTITFFFGILFLILGMYGEYLYRIYEESVQRPLYLVAATAGGDGPGPQPAEAADREVAGA